VVEGRVAVANALPAGLAEDVLGGAVYRAGLAPRLAFSLMMPAAAPADLDLDDEDPEDDLAADELADLDDEDLAIDEDGSDAGQSTLASSWAGLVESKPIGSPDADRLREEIGHAHQEREGQSPHSQTGLKLGAI
jgi:hypothetical protein